MKSILILMISLYNAQAKLSNSFLTTEFADAFIESSEECKESVLGNCELPCRENSDVYLRVNGKIQWPSKSC